MSQMSMFVPCPSCQCSIHVDDSVCPHCGQQAFDAGVISSMAPPEKSTQSVVPVEDAPLPAVSRR